jgi:hypothetical protein
MAGLHSPMDWLEDELVVEELAGQDRDDPNVALPMAGTQVADGHLPGTPVRGVVHEPRHEIGVLGAHRRPT